ncbi:MAG: hypothetical protein A3C35_06785 [Omnitrophica bacterium RIFCSPHIGHO2_02_FULL_46_11]|nr:MAG: hypothetical protein A3C35_06785 [Omnitrophica bacterium RIFCSPHIGHO2_02_FULL_46_11]OGW86738.1 MAG: hypothetical protein A3A81_08685 [Omnitrophica bacterium RIFCSPLOWO2_01_FULL_45_10b]
MILISSLFFGIASAGLTWFFIHRYQDRSALAQRLSSLSGNLSFPYRLPSADSLRSDTKNTDQITLDTSYEDKITRQLFVAGVRHRKSVRFYRFVVRLSFILPIVLIVLYALMGSLTLKNLILFAGLGIAFYGYVWLVLRALKQRQQKKILRALPQFFDLLVVCVEAGLNFSAALPRVIQDMDPEEPVIKEFDHMHRELMGGLSLAQACDRLAQRCEVLDLSIILTSIIQSDQMGSGLAQVLRIQSAELRDKLRQRMREKAYRIPLKLLFPMVLIFITLFTMTLGPAFLELSSGIGGR